MDVAYDGAKFHGFARNPEVVTIAGVLEQTLGVVLRHDVSITGAGRTDRGVHASGQVLSFDADADFFDPVAVKRAVNRMLRPSIVVRHVQAAPPTFSARLSCVGRSYRYNIRNDAVPDPLLGHLEWHVPDLLELRAMNAACDQIMGAHDFSAFCKRNKSRPTESLVRRIEVAEWSARGTSVRFDIRARSFAHQMVRSLVGMMVEIGRGRRRTVDMGVVLRSLDRQGVGSPAPPHGLVFTEAHY